MQDREGICTELCTMQSGGGIFTQDCVLCRHRVGEGIQKHRTVHNAGRGKELEIELCTMGKGFTQGVVHNAVCNASWEGWVRM